MKKALNIILALSVAVSAGASVSVSKSCGMTGCSIKTIKSACCCKVMQNTTCLCDKKISIKKTDNDFLFIALNHPANPLQQFAITVHYNAGYSIHVGSSFTQAYHRQKFKPDHHINTPLLA